MYFTIGNYIYYENIRNEKVGFKIQGIKKFKNYYYSLVKSNPELEAKDKKQLFNCYNRAVKEGVC